MRTDAAAALRRDLSRRRLHKSGNSAAAVRVGRSFYCSADRSRHTNPLLFHRCELQWLFAAHVGQRVAKALARRAAALYGAGEEFLQLTAER